MSEVTASSAHVPAVHARKYAQQLCKHRAHNLTVTLDGDTGRIVFPANARGADWPGDAVILLAAGETEIACRIEASAPGQLDGLKGALARHLDRFDWVDE